MAYNPQYKMSMQDAAGNYLTADLQADCTYIINTSPTIEYIEVLPDGWSGTETMFERDMYYIGIFRSMSSNGSYQFSMDGRAILQSLYASDGIQAECTLTIWVLRDSDWGYDVYYPSQFDFKTYSDNTQNELLNIHTLDNGLIRDLHAYGDTDFNIPVWYIDPTSGIWVTDADFLIHDGIKLLYNATFVSSATDAAPLDYSAGLRGFNDGNHGTGVNDGRHTIPAMSPFSITQNNGATTFIGNDILAQNILQRNQTPGANNTINERNFDGINNSQPYTKSNFCLKDLLPSATGSITMSVAVSGQFKGNITGFPTGAGAAIKFVIFEIDETDNSTVGLYTYTSILDIQLPTTGGSTYTPPNDGKFSNYVGGSVPVPSGGTMPANPATITLNLGKVYVFGVIWDNTAHLFQANLYGMMFSSLQFSFLSNYDFGSSGIPIQAPALPATVFPVFRPKQLLQKLIPYLATTQTDSYGFPIPVTTPYSGDSTFLDKANITAVGDVVPAQIGWTSEYCLHHLQGQSYLTLSVNKFFEFLKKQLGCGATIEGQTFRIEDYAYFFNSSKMILDLGYDIVDEEITPLTEGLGANLKLGYSKADTNSDFGVDALNTGLYFNTPLSNIKGQMDFEVTDVLCEQYAIEKIRAQIVSQPIGTSYDPASPSSNNQNIILYTLPTPTQWLDPVTVNPAYPNIHVYDPANNPKPVGSSSTPEIYQLTQRNGVNLPAMQSTDPTAATAPYMQGAYYPDSYINVELSPCRMLERGTGGWLHSILDKMDTEYLTFRNTYVMQYNNSTAAVTGMASNLRVGAGASPIVEFSDKLIGGLPAKYFDPVQLKVRSRYPADMYKILQTDPNGYVRYYVKDNRGYGHKERKGFLMRAKQTANQNPNEFYLLALAGTIL